MIPMLRDFACARENAPLRLVPLLFLLFFATVHCKVKEYGGGELQSTPQDKNALVELNSSIITMGMYDITSDRCLEMVDRAASYKQTKVMFVPTLFWVQTGDGPVDHYCYDRQYAKDSVRCDRVDDQKIKDFRQAIQRCFQRAVDANLSIAITPHLDDGTGQGRWRNLLAFDPSEKRGGYSYAEVVLDPLADALNTVAKDSTKIYFGLQGEMSATVFRYPAAWRAMAREARRRLARNRSEEFKKNIQVGVSTNFNKLCGCVGLEIVDPAEYVSKYPALWEKQKAAFNVPEIGALYQDIDYFGISSYPSLTPQFATDAVERAIEQFDFEFQYFGMSVSDLLRKGKKLHFSEYGLGGGKSQNGDAKAQTATEAAQLPFFGIFGVYNAKTDPWELSEGSKIGPVRQYMHYFYQKSLEYLRYERAYKYRVDAAFLWNLSSWDIQGIYPSSRSQDGSYRDPVVVDMINRHNAAAAPKP